MGWYIAGAVVSLAISLFLCTLFADIAVEKGYSRSTYFLICLFCGILGYIWVAALPDQTLRTKVAELEGKQKEASKKPADVGVDKWVCGACQTENSMNYSQCKKCGRFRG